MKQCLDLSLSKVRVKQECESQHRFGMSVLSGDHCCGCTSSVTFLNSNKGYGPACRERTARQNLSRERRPKGCTTENMAKKTSTHSDEAEVRDSQHCCAILQRRGHGHREVLLRHVLRRAEARVLWVEGPVVERGSEELRRIETVRHVRRWAVREGDDDGDLL